MNISIIAAVGKNLELGKGNELVWHFREDMKFFKETTTGNTVIMGRKTFESLPHALPNRRNVVITTNADYVAEGAEVVTSLEAAMELTKNDNVFIIGGGTIYTAFMPYATKLYLTEIDATDDEADVFFPSFDKENYTREQLTDFTVDGINFKHILYTKR